MTDNEQLETMLRSSLSERAGDVDTTPALYERVQRQATRGAWLRRGVALAGAAAAVVVAVAVVPALLPDQPLVPDVVDTPEDAAPSQDPTEPEPSPGTAVTDPLLEANVAFADANGLVNVGQRAVTSPAPVVSLAVSPFWTEDAGAVAAGLEDGRIGVVQPASIGGDRFDLLVDAAANGGGVGFSPDGQAIAWIEGTDLHVLPLATAPDGERVLPLQGDVPDDLVFEQWFYGADAQLVLASDPSGGVWRIPMDDSDAFDSEPTDPASLLPAAADADAVDAALLDDLSLAVLRVPADGTTPTLTLGGLPVEVDEVVDVTTELSVTGSSLTLFDPTTGIGSRHAIEVDSFDAVARWETPGITAVAPLPSNRDGTDASVPGTDPALDDAAALGLPTDAPVAGTAGTDLLVRTADGQVQTIAVYPPESEATLGRLAVRPHSTLEDGLVAVESFSEGENSVRFVALRDGAASPVGEVLVTDGPVTGLVWSEDGGTVIWSDDEGIHAASVAGEGDVAGFTGTLRTGDTGPVLDAVWTQLEMDGDFVARASGYLAVGVNGVTGVELIGLEREGDATLRLTEQVGGADRVVLDTHASPGAAVGPEVIAHVAGGRAALRWSADGDRSGALPDAGQLGGDVRVDASGGQVLVMGDSRQVLVTFDGEVVDLPTAADWDVLD